MCCKAPQNESKPPAAKLVEKFEARFRVQRVGLRVQGLGHRVQGLS